MNPIINPFWFYLIGISENIKDFSMVIGILLTIAGFICFIMPYLLSMPYSSGDQYLISISSKYRKFLGIGLLLCLMSILTPSEKSCYQMLTASIVTPNNIEAVGEAATDIVDYIVESVDTLLEDSIEED